MCDVSFIILHIEFDQAVGIGPRKFRHRSLLEFRYLVRVRRASVMCQQWAANNQKTNAQNERHQQLAFHSAPPKKTLRFEPTPWKEMGRNPLFTFQNGMIVHLFRLSATLRIRISAAKNSPTIPPPLPLHFVDPSAEMDCLK
jgi:hypothetical protein